MYNNKKGLSTIVATLLIILLTLVAVGIVWVVVRGVVQNASGNVDIEAKCLQANIIATNVDNTSATSFDVTLSRQGGGDEIGGVKLVFMNDSETVTYVADISGNIAPLATVTKNVMINETYTTLTNPSSVEVVAYFLDDSGNEQLCSSNENIKQF